MKKTAILFLSLLLILATVFPAFADLGEPEFDNWFVFCGNDGYDFDWTDYDGTTYHTHVEPGIRFQVWYYNRDLKEYTLVVQDDQEAAKTIDAFPSVTEDELHTYFLEKNESVDPDTGTKLDTEVKGTVKPSEGLILRQGPAKTFQRYLTIPCGAELRYQYTFTSSDGLNWGYTSYSGKQGWACIDYVEASTPDTTETESTTQASTTDASTTVYAPDQPSYNYAPLSPSASTSTSSAAESGTGASESTENAESTTLPEETEPQSAGFFESTDNVIIVSCIGAVLIALTALAVVLIIFRRKK